MDKKKNKKEDKKQNLLEDEGEEVNDITINEKFAAKYTDGKRKQELAMLKATYGSEEEEDDLSEEDDDAINDLPEWDDAYLKLLPKLATKNKEIYEKKDFFPEPATRPTIEKKAKPVHLRTFIREKLIENEGKEIDEEAELEKMRKNTMVAAKDSVREQFDLKQNFKKAFAEAEAEDDDDFFSVKSKSQKDKEDEDKAFNVFKAKEDKNDSNNDMKLLEQFWKAKEVDPAEKYLRDYILNKRWMAKPGDTDTNDDPKYWNNDFEEADNEDDEAIAKQEKFEEDYIRNLPDIYRFQEEGSDKVITYAREVEDSVRRKKSTRADARQRKNEREKEMKDKRTEELKQLKILKRQEIMDKLKEIESITGTQVFDEADLDKDYDPEEWDRKMSQAFDDEFYGQEETEKPAMDNEMKKILEQNYDEEDYYEDPTAYNEEGNHEEGDYEEGNDEEGDNEEGREENKKKPLQQLQLKGNDKIDEDGYIFNGGRRRKVRSSFHRIKLSKLGTEQQQKFEEYLDDYYKLDYEDIINGEIPTRFKYTETKPSDFGLTLEEILTTEDKELNKKVPMKYYAPYGNLRWTGNPNRNGGKFGNQSKYEGKKEFNNNGNSYNGKKEYNNNATNYKGNNYNGNNYNGKKEYNESGSNYNGKKQYNNNYGKKEYNNNSNYNGKKEYNNNGNNYNETNNYNGTKKEYNNEKNYSGKKEFANNNSSNNYGGKKRNFTNPNENQQSSFKKNSDRNDKKKNKKQKVETSNDE